MSLDDYSMPEIKTEHTDSGWRAYMPGTKLECFEDSKAHSIRTLREIYKEKIDCDTYLEHYAKRLNRGQK